MKIEAFFDQATFTLTYVVWDEDSLDAVIIDPVADYDPAGSALSFESVEKVLKFVNDHHLKVHLILETHAHADHVSGSQPLKEKLPEAKIAISDQITEVQKAFKGVFNFSDHFATDGSQFDRLLRDNEVVEVGRLKFKVMHTPGHTEACSSFLFDGVVFTGDALFMPDFGVARCDFPNGSAETLYDSVAGRLYSLPDETRYFTGHDYQPGGRELQYESTIGVSKEKNIHLPASRSKEDFVKFRTERDAQLNAPRLLLPSVQINANAGVLPEPESNGVSYLKIPVQVKNG